MCREEAREAFLRVDEMKAAGAKRVIALVKEDIGTEVSDFREGWWKEQIFLDGDMRFFTALGGGAAHKPYGGLAAFLAMLANPFSKTRVKGAFKRADQKGVTGNMNGEGFIAGGVYVVRVDGMSAYTFLEEDIGDHAPVEDVIEGIKAAVKGEEYVSAPRGMLGAAEEDSSCRRTWKVWAGRNSGPDGYLSGDISRGIAASVARCKCNNRSTV